MKYAPTFQQPQEKYDLCIVYISWADSKKSTRKSGREIERLKLVGNNIAELFQRVSYGAIKMNAYVDQYTCTLPKSKDNLRKVQRDIPYTFNAEENQIKQLFMIVHGVKRVGSVSYNIALTQYGSLRAAKYLTGLMLGLRGAAAYWLRDGSYQFKRASDRLSCMSNYKSNNGLNAAQLYYRKLYAQRPVALYDFSEPVCTYDLCLANGEPKLGSVNAVMISNDDGPKLFVALYETKNRRMLALHSGREDCSSTRLRVFVDSMSYEELQVNVDSKNEDTWRITLRPRVDL